MSDKIPTSSRLDSLSRRATPGPKPGLKFKPKVVARRSKQERDAEAPVTAPEGDKSRDSRGNNARGRGGARGGRGGRGGRALAGTHVISLGPLAAGNILSGSDRSAPRSSTASPTPDYLSNLVKKERDQRSTSAELDSDDEDGDATQINMNEEYKFDPEHTELFPVRPIRREHREPGDHKAATLDAQEVRSVSPEVVEQGKSDNNGGLVKEEPQDKDLNTVLHEKDTELQKKLNDLQLQNEFLSVDPTEARAETERINKDHRSIVKSIVEADNNPEKFLFFKLPRVLPNFEEDEQLKAQRAAKKVQVKAEKEADGDVSMVSASGEDNKPEDDLDHLEGLVGKLRVHKSGKLTMKLGNVVMDVGKGSETNFLQEVVLADSDRGKNAYLLGHLQEKVVVIPRFA